MLLCKSIHEDLLPFMYDETSAIKTYVAVIDHFPKPEAVIRKLGNKAESLTPKVPDQYVGDHQRL